MEYDNFNEYMNDLNNAEKFQGYETLENFYFTHSALLKEFVGIENQFKMWLDKNTYNANAIAHLLPELPNLISNLSEIRFQLTEIDNYEDNITLSKLIRYIKNVMTFSEVKNNFEKLVIESNNNLKSKQERQNKELRKNEKQNELKTKINFNSNLLLYFEGINKSYIDLCDNNTTTIELICNEINKFDNTINALNTLKQDIDLIEKYNIVSKDLKEQIFYIKKIMLLGELQEELNKFIRIKIENVTIYKKQVLFEKIKLIPNVGLIERQIQDIKNSNDLFAIIRFISNIESSSIHLYRLELVLKNIEFMQIKLNEQVDWWVKDIERLEGLIKDYKNKENNSKFESSQNFLDVVFSNSKEYYWKQIKECRDSIDKVKPFTRINVKNFKNECLNRISIPFDNELLNNLEIEFNDKFNKLLKSMTL